MKTFTLLRLALLALLLFGASGCETAEQPDRDDDNLKSVPSHHRFPDESVYRVGHHLVGAKSRRLHFANS